MLNYMVVSQQTSEHICVCRLVVSEATQQLKELHVHFGKYMHKLFMIKINLRRCSTALARACCLMHLFNL
jgi:hypothetical protein